MPLFSWEVIFSICFFYEIFPMIKIHWTLVKPQQYLLKIDLLCTNNKLQDGDLQWGWTEKNANTTGGNIYVKKFHKIRLTTCAIDFQNKIYHNEKTEIIEHKSYEVIRKLFFR